MTQSLSTILLVIKILPITLPADGPSSYQNKLKLGFLLRETVPSQTSDIGKRTVSVIAHSFLLP